jgi:hypothetical protein
VIRRLRSLFLFGCSIALITLAGYLLVGTPLAMPAALAGVGSFLLALW